tara:strand:+ start:448 stop:654 length:207 start_codon:yes stop_codon:yes gene_type:complete
MNNLTVVHYRYKDDTRLLAKRFNNGADASKFLENKLGFNLLDYHRITTIPKIEIYNNLTNKMMTIEEN